MKIVDYDTFIKLPVGTMYCETEPYIFGEIKIKQETINDGNDWFYQSFQDNLDKEDWKEDIYNECLKREVNLDFDIQTRDGMFDYQRTFAIYSQKDIQDMINKLQSILIK